MTAADGPSPMTDHSEREEMKLPYEDCPTCGLHWYLFAPAKIEGKEAVRCVECKAVYPLSTATTGADVAVLPLEWTSHPSGGEQALAAGLSLYRVHANGNDWYLVPDHMGGGGKAAAQADYEKRVRSAISALPDPAGESVTVEDLATVLRDQNDRVLKFSTFFEDARALLSTFTITRKRGTRS